MHGVSYSFYATNPWSGYRPAITFTHSVYMKTLTCQQLFYSFIYLAIFQYSIKKMNTTLVYMYIVITIISISYQFFGVIWKVVCAYVFLLYSAWNLVDDVSTYNFCTLDSFTPFTNHYIFNKHTYWENMTQIERENHWNCRWLILACTTFVFARKAYLRIQINCRTLVIQEGMNVNCDVPSYAKFIHSQKACVLDFTEYCQWSYLYVCPLICHKLINRSCT